MVQTSLRAFLILFLFALPLSAEPTENRIRAAIGNHVNILMQPLGNTVVAHMQVRSGGGVWTNVGFGGSDSAVPVNVVAGGAGGGVAQTQVRNSGDSAWVNVGFNAANLRMPVDLYSIGGTAQSGAQLVDVVNTAFRVNVVAGGAGGGLSQTQVRNAGDTAWVNVGPAAGNAKMPATLYTSGGTEIAPLTDTQLRASAVPVTANAGTNLNTSLLALESGGNLAAIKTDTDKIPSLGQALAAASVPVVLTAAQVTTLTPPAAITNFANETGGNLAAIKAKTDNIPTSPATDATTGEAHGTVAAGTVASKSNLIGAQFKTTQPTFTDAQGGALMMSARGALYVVPGVEAFNVANSGTFAVQATLAAETSKVIGTVNPGNTANTTAWLVTGTGGTFPVTGTFWQSTQPVSLASGQVASGAIASGAVASGAFASGSIASGAVASGAYASGSISDGAMVTLGAKTDAKSTATDATSVTIMQVLKEISAMAQAPAALPANQSINTAQWNAHTVVEGLGAPANGSPRVTTAYADTPTIGPILCEHTKVYDASTNGKTTLVAVSGSTTVYVCGYSISQSTTSAVTVSLGLGTGTDCATTYTAITPGHVLQAGTSTGPIGIVVPVSNSPGLNTGASKNLCIQTNAAVSVQALVFYAQF